MALTQRLDLRQSQTLVMTPQMQQAIKLLQYSSLELAAFVSAELERNPLLDWDGDDGGEKGRDRIDDGASSDLATPARSPAETVDTHQLTSRETFPASDESPLDTEAADLYDSSPQDQLNDPASSGAEASWPLSGEGFPERSRSGSAEPAVSLEERLAQNESLRDHLIGQLNLELGDPADRMIGLHLIDLLDDSGYLRIDVQALAEQLGCPPARIEAVWSVLKGFEPTGIFAASLGECLALQLAEQNRLDPAMQALLENLPLLARRDFAALKSLCGVDDEDLAEMVAEVKGLNPKPAADFLSPEAEAVVPDIFLRPGPDQGWQVELNSDALPRVLIDRRYHAVVSAQARSRADRDFISAQFQSANWLVRALHQRATTILKVAEEVVRRQDGFFCHGVRHLRPLTLRDVAEAVELHESTVSRATAGKYMETPRGVFELKYFFTTAIAGADGESHSAEAVRHRIRQLIEAESPKSILSDDKIVTVLRGEGIDIARRTVAKYREAMRIPASVQRRREKALGVG